MIESIFELPSQVTSSLSASDCERWMQVYNECNPKSEDEVRNAKKEAWRACRELPSSFSFEIVASTETIDKSKEIIDLDSIKKTLDSFIDYGGNVQLDHRNYTVGTIWDWKPATIDTEEGKVPGVVAYGNLFGGDFVYDTVRKHFVNGMNSLSIGGEATHGNYQCDEKGCYTKKDLKQLMEISVCTEPMNKYSKMVWYNKGASLTKSASAANFKLRQYTVHKDETTCPLLSLRKSLRKIGYDAHAKIDGVHIKMDPNEYARTYPLFKSHGIVACYNKGDAVLSWVKDAESIMKHANWKDYGPEAEKTVREMRPERFLSMGLGDFDPSKINPDNISTGFSFKPSGSLYGSKYRADDPKYKSDWDRYAQGEDFRTSDQGFTYSFKPDARILRFNSFDDYKAMPKEYWEEIPNRELMNVYSKLSAEDKAKAPRFKKIPNWARIAQDYDAVHFSYPMVEEGTMHTMGMGDSYMEEYPSPTLDTEQVAIFNPDVITDLKKWSRDKGEY